MTNESNDQQATDWIKILNLKSHLEEGGFYSEIYCSDDQCTLERYDKQQRSCGTSIYYFLKLPDAAKSYFHRIKADEIWHFYKGLPLIIHVLEEENASHTEYILHNEFTLHADARPQILVPHGKWFAAELIPTHSEEQKDTYTLCGCTCTPGFDFKDFELAKRSELIKKFPKFKELIIRLTPSE